jgi:putative flippase GtrA
VSNRKVLKAHRIRILVAGSPWDRNRPLRFLVIGAINTAFGYLSYVGLFLLLQNTWHYLSIAFLNHFVAVSFAYYMQRQVVFRSSMPWWPEFIKFNTSILMITGLGLAGLYLCVSVFNMHPLVGQAAVTCVSVVASYIAHRHFSFRTANQDE